MYKEALRPAWVEINLGNLDYNIKQIRQKTRGCDTIGVVKADAYGHGAAAVSKVLLENGVKTLAVAALQEAVSLRENGFTCPIVMLGITPELYAETLLEYSITPVVSSAENAAAISAAAGKWGKTIEAFVAVDTGMGRIGFQPDDACVEAVRKISLLPYLKIKGLFSHFATADEKDKSYALRQLSHFNTIYERLKQPEWTSCQNHRKQRGHNGDSRGLFRSGPSRIILYGCYPSQEVDRSRFSIKPVMSVKANTSI
jgi:alanine racemase